MKRGYMSRLLPYIWRAEDKKPPKGFEKFFKKKEEREAESKHDKSNYNFWLIYLNSNDTL